MYATIKTECAVPTTGKDFEKVYKIRQTELRSDFLLSIPLFTAREIKNGSLSLYKHHI